MPAMEHYIVKYRPVKNKPWVNEQELVLWQTFDGEHVFRPDELSPSSHRIIIKESQIISMKKVTK